MITPANKKLRDHQTIFAYGFDRAGFTTPHDPIVIDRTVTLQFVDFYSSRSLTESDGIIVPQGIFEQIETRSDLFSGLFGEKTFVSVDRSLMLERERQLFNLLRDGKWVCFLVAEIVDQIAQGLHSEAIRDTDLCKRILNAFTIERRRRYRLESPLELKVRDDEFRPYFNRYGNPTTVFELPQDVPMERHAIAWLGNGVVGVEIDSQLFFLPFECSRRTSEQAMEIVTLLTVAVSEYRRFRLIDVPDWVEEFHFKSEEPLYLQINDLLGRVNRLESELASWKDYKAILASSGIYLRNKLIALFESVFGFRIQSEDAEEKFVIVKRDDSPVVFIQSEGTQSPVQKSFVEQLARSRKQYGLPDSFPAALLINNEMSSASIGARSKTTVTDDVVEFANSHNVLIIRTIDLLFLINHLENSPNKKSRMLHLLTSGGGWLKATSGSYDVIHS